MAICLRETSIKQLLSLYRSEQLEPRVLIQDLVEKQNDYLDNPIWIYRLSMDELEPYLIRLQRHSPEELPLYGIPFVLKDNIDLADCDTTAACSEFSYRAVTSASVVQRLIAAGAIPLGKTNLDQFATGLVGTRSPWGACKNAFNSDYIAGGSSSGSAVAVALGLASFSLGTDTAGSGRVPASLNGLVGLKPTRGLISCQGVVPACKSLDCVSIFANNIDDANTVFDWAVGSDDDTYGRVNRYTNSKRYGIGASSEIILGVPSNEHLNFFGNDEASQLFSLAISKVKQQGIQIKLVDFSVFIEAAKLLYEGPWLAERYWATRALRQCESDGMLDVTHSIIENGANISAVDAFSSMYQLQSLKQKADKVLAQVDAIITPTIGTIYKISEVEKSPITTNSNLGYYTNFMNLLDYAAVAIPCDMFQNGVGFGLSIFGPAFTDKQLMGVASQLNRCFSGDDESTTKKESRTIQRGSYQTIELVVCGAHMEGMPLNWQLTERGAVKIESTQTSEYYHFYALAGDLPKRPGLLRCEKGCAISVEVWKIPNENFGSFVNEIPAPLAIGKIELSDGRWLSGFTCESYGLSGAEDITKLKSWHNYLAMKK